MPNEPQRNEESSSKKFVFLKDTELVSLSEVINIVFGDANATHNNNFPVQFYEYLVRSDRRDLNIVGIGI